MEVCIVAVKSVHEKRNTPLNLCGLCDRMHLCPMMGGNSIMRLWVVKCKIKNQFHAAAESSIVSHFVLDENI